MEARDKTDDELIAQAVTAAKIMATTPDLWGRTPTAEACMRVLLLDDAEYRAAVARHLLSRDPECVRVPMKGTVS